MAADRLARLIRSPLRATLISMAMKEGLIAALFRHLNFDGASPGFTRDAKH